MPQPVPLRVVLQKQSTVVPPSGYNNTPSRYNICIDVIRMTHDYIFIQSDLYYPQYLGVLNFGLKIADNRGVDNRGPTLVCFIFQEINTTFYELNGILQLLGKCC